MVCIYCGEKTKVTNSRGQKRVNQIWRRRQCLTCQATFTTEEQAVTDTSLLVSSAKRVEPFSREKLLLSVYDALRHRKTAISDATALCDTIWNQLQPQIAAAQLERGQIVKTTHKILKRFDKAGATAYLAFHPLKP